MRFLYPQFLNLLFLLVPLLALWAYHISVKYKTRLSLGDSQPLRSVSNLSSLKRDGARYALLNAVMVFLVFALAHPQIAREKEVAQPRKMDIVFLLDNSPSMRADDISPSRLERAMEVIGEFSKKMLSHDRVGLVAFSQGSLILSYLTKDPSNILYYLDYYKKESIPNLGTNIGRALKSGLSVFAKESQVSPETVRHKKVLILVSDGDDHGKELEEAIEATKGVGIKVHTIGIGSKDGAAIPIGRDNGKIKYLEDADGKRIISRFSEETLDRIAAATDGNAYRSFTGQELEGIFSEIVVKEREVEGYKKVVEYEDVYQSLLLLALGAFFILLLI